MKRSNLPKVLINIILLICVDSYATNNSCENFAETKSMLQANMRAYQCAGSDGLDTCKEFLGLGELGAIAAMGGTAAIIGKNAVSKIRNPDFVLCPIGHAYWQTSPLIKLLIPTAWAACIAAEPLLQKQLKNLAETDVAEIDRRIQEQQKQIDEMNESKKQYEQQQALAANKDKAEEIKKLRESLADYQNKTKEVLQDLTNTVATLPAAMKPDIESNLARIREETSASGNLDPYDRRVKAQRSINDYFDGLKGLTPAQKAKLKEQAWNVADQDLGVSIYSQRLETGGYAKTATASTAKFDAKVAGELESNLAVLKAQKQKLVGVLSELTKPIYQLPKTFDLLKENMLKLVGTGSISSKTRQNLIAMDAQLAHLEFKPQVRTSGMWSGRSIPLRTVNPKILLARGMAGVLLTTGAMSAAQAAGVEEQVDNAMSFTDPFSFAMRVVGGDHLGGNCGMNIPSPYFPMDPDRGCNYDYTWNEKIQAAAAEASDSQLAEMFKQPGVCAGILANFKKYYPTPSSKVKCQSPLNVKLSDGSSFVYKENDYLITTGTKGERVGYYVKSNGTHEYSTAKDGEKVTMSGMNFSEEFPDHFGEFVRLKALAISMNSCCQESGMRPPQKECAGYGINTGTSSESQIDSGNQ